MNVDHMLSALKVSMNVLLCVTLCVANSSYANEKISKDSQFGLQIYNEASPNTKQEILKLLSEKNSSESVFMHALSMGNSIEEIVDAAIRLDNSRGREFVQSAVNVLPFIPEVSQPKYNTYSAEDLVEPYTVKDVAQRFFEKQEVLETKPNWYDNETHLSVSPKELLSLLAKPKRGTWYENGLSSEKLKDSQRPIFVSLYEATQTILVDNVERIEEAVKSNIASIPVVFIFNDMSERSYTQLIDYPQNISGFQDAYTEKGLMVTPTPEWQKGDYHIMGKVKELKTLFNIPQESDFEPTQWQALLDEVQSESTIKPAFWVLILPNSSNSDDTNDFSATEDSIVTQNSRGLVISRADKVAALDSLGVETLPIAFFYMDQTRIRPFNTGIIGIQRAAINAGMSAQSFGLNSNSQTQTNVGGGFGGVGSISPSGEQPNRPQPPRPEGEPPCASPPCDL